MKTIGAEKLILDFLKNPEEAKLSFVTSIFEKLEAFLFYQMIAKMNGIPDPFDSVLVKAYWLGNRLLKTIENKDILFVSPAYFIKLSDLIGTKPHHNFGVLWPTKKTKNIPLKKIDECLVKPGRVIKVKQKTILVETISLFRKGKKINFRRSNEEVSKEVMKGLIGHGDWVSIHFDMARERISRNCANNLAEITKEAISFFNR